MIPIEAVSMKTIDDFFNEFIENAIKEFTGGISAEGALIIKWLKQSGAFREYILGQRHWLMEGLDAQSILTATFCVGYRLALFAAKSPGPPGDGKNKPV